MSNLTKCEICGRNFVSSIGLINHIRHKHIKQNHIESLEVYYLKYIDSNPRTCCKTCGKQTEFVNFDTGYKVHCDHACAVNDLEVSERRNINFKTALREKYGEGIENASQIPGHSDRVKKTKLERYGDENYLDSEKLSKSLKEHYRLHSEEHYEKYRKTCLEKYGVEYHTRSDVCKEKSKATCLERYGVENSLKCPEVIEKIRKKFAERYGGYTWASPTLMEKVHKTMNERYGANTAYESPIIMEKIKNTNIERYGAASPLQNKDILHKALSKQRNESYLLKERVINGVTIHVQSKAEVAFVDQQILLGNTIYDGPQIEYVFEGKKRVYFVDFCIEYPDLSRRLIEVKQRHGWFFRELNSGKLLAKVRAAQEYSRKCFYLPYKLLFIETKHVTD
jgi:hypothetical protein